MLVLDRKKLQTVVATASNGEQITISVQAVRGQRVKLGLEADSRVKFRRGELPEKPKAA